LLITFVKIEITIVVNISFTATPSFPLSVSEVTTMKWNDIRQAERLAFASAKVLKMKWSDIHQG
jgi:hypothetical protein